MTAILSAWQGSFVRPRSESTHVTLVAVSKLTDFATLDRRIMQIHQIHNDTVLAAVKEDKTSIPTSKRNSNAYEGWCEHLAHIAQTYLPTARVVDIERGLFQMIQAGRVKEAASILKTA